MKRHLLELQVEVDKFIIIVGYILNQEIESGHKRFE